MLDIRFPDWAVMDRQAGQSLIFGVYDGKVYIRVRGRGGDKNAPPLFLKKLDRPSLFRKFRKIAEKIITCPPETKLPIKFTSFDMQSKQEKLVWVFVFEKDSKMCYRLHLTDAQNGGRTFTFALNGSRSVQIGADPMTESDRSAGLNLMIRMLHSRGVMVATAVDSIAVVVISRDSSNHSLHQRQLQHLIWAVIWIFPSKSRSNTKVEMPLRRLLRCRVSSSFSHFD